MHCLECAINYKCVCECRWESVRTGVMCSCSLPLSLFLPKYIAGRIPSPRAHGPVALLPPWYAWQGTAVLLGSLGLVCPQLVREGKRRSGRV